MSTKKTIEFHRGESWLIGFTCHNADNSIMDLTAATLFFRLAKGQTALFTKTLGGGITVTNAVGGVGNVLITPDDQTAAAIGEGKDYNYELKVVIGAFVSIQCEGVLKSATSLFYP